MLRRNVTSDDLQAFQGKNIKEICEIGYSTSSDNHCAHFVSHVMGYTFGAVTCGNLNWKLKQAAKKIGQLGFTLRVDDVFRACLIVGEWAARPVTLKQCIAFITDSANVNLKVKYMGNMPRKHIGIFCGGRIWHYSNSKNSVISQTPEEFSRHYGGSAADLQRYRMFFGEFPTGV